MGKYNDINYLCPIEIFRCRPVTNTTTVARTSSRARIGWERPGHRHSSSWSSALRAPPDLCKVLLCALQFACTANAAASPTGDVILLPRPLPLALYIGAHGRQMDGAGWHAERSGSLL